MKTRHDPRHQARIARVRALFAYSFDNSQTEGIESIVPQLEMIDTQIKAVAKERPIDQIAKLDLAILRESVFELQTDHLIPSIVIDEAVEIAKEFGSDASPKFIHGVLRTIVETYDRKE